MVGGIVEITQSGRFLRLDRGSMVIEADKEEIGRVPLDDMDILILGGRCTVSSPLLEALAEEGAVTLLCGKNYAPLGLLIPIEGMGESATRARAQISASEPLRKRLWQRIVAAKIERQSEVLKFRGREIEAGNLKWLSANVNSGDTDNKEAQAARKYWPALMGDSFLRSDENNSINAMLNYGYAILRSAVSRAIVAVGLLPQFGVNHCGPRDTFALADDLMEPFRPLVDLIVCRLRDSGSQELSVEAKKELAKMLILDIPTSRGISTLSEGLHMSALSLSDSFLGKKSCIDLPNPLANLLGQKSLT